MSKAAPEGAVVDIDDPGLGAGGVEAAVGRSCQGGGAEAALVHGARQAASHAHVPRVHHPVTAYKPTTHTVHSVPATSRPLPGSLLSSYSTGYQPSA